MAVNYLESLISEWLEYKGLFVRTNVLVGPRAKGGYECELDVVAIDVKEKKILQFEPTMDALSWKDRETRFKKKFDAGKKYIPELFVDFMKIHPDWIEQYAVLGFGSDKNYKTIGGGVVLTARNLFNKIMKDLENKKIESQAVPENMPRLRTIQFMLNYFRVHTI
jgi:hypothetical protein